MMKKFNVFLFVVVLLFSFSVIGMATDLETEVTEVSSHEQIEEQTRESQVQQSEDNSETETSVSDLEVSSGDNSPFTSEVEALTEIYNQNIYILFGIFCCFGAMIASAFSFWKW